MKVGWGAETFEATGLKSINIKKIKIMSPSQHLQMTGRRTVFLQQIFSGSHCRKFEMRDVSTALTRLPLLIRRHFFYNTNTVVQVYGRGNLFIKRRCK